MSNSAFQDYPSIHRSTSGSRVIQPVATIKSTQPCCPYFLELAEIVGALLVRVDCNVRERWRSTLISSRPWRHSLTSSEDLKVWLDFVSLMVKALAWPLTVVFSLVLLRNPLKDLIPLVKKLKLKEFELEFAQQLAEVKEEAQASLPSTRETRLTRSDSQDRILDLLVVSRASAILEAWREVELAAIDASRRHGMSENIVTPGRLGEKLRSVGVLDDRQADIYNKLQFLRNTAVHGGSQAVRV